MTLLFSPLTIRNTTFKNRMVVSPMCMYRSEDGFADDFHLVHLGSRAMGGFGLIIQEATSISPEGRITPGDLGIWKDEHIPKLKEIVAFCQSHGSLMGIQLAHAGRKASCVPPFEGRHQIRPDQPDGWQTLGPSAIGFRDTDAPPLAMEEEDIEKLKQDYISAIRRSKEIGYDVLEIHAAHGYLLHQFLSPLSNKRKDKYGGSFENRIRLVLEIVEIAKKEWGEEKPFFVRVSATDWTEDGWNIEETIELSKKLRALGVDLIDVSSGGNAAVANIPVFPGYQVEFAEKIKAQAGILTGAVGKITTGKQSEEILQKGQADLIFYARETLRQPYLPLIAADELDEEVTWPKEYERARRRKTK